MKFNLQAKLVIGIILLLTAVCSALGVMTVINVRHQLATAANEKAKSDSETSLAVIDLTYPGPWSIKDGILYKGTAKISGNDEIVDKIGKLTENTVTVFLNDTRVATNIIADGQRATGTKAPDNIVDTVLKAGQAYSGEVNILGVNYHAHYVPIKDSEGKIIGMFYIGISKQFADELEQGFIIKFVEAILLCLVVFSIGGWYISRKIIKPIIEMDKMVSQIAQGNLNATEIGYTSQDEIGNLGRGLNSMLSHLKGLIVQITGSAKHVADIVRN